MPVPSGWGFAVVVLVWACLVLCGFVAITVGANQLVARWIGREAGCLVGGIAACAWVWLLAKIDHVGLSTYALALIGIPALVVAASRLHRRETTAPD